MIKNITKFVFASLLSITYLHANVVTINGVEWEYCDDYFWNSDETIETIGVAITGASQVSGELIIPSKINGRSVTSIECDAFSGCSGLTSVTIPDSVTSIGHTAFYNCTNLKSVNLGNGIKRLGWNNDSWEGIFEGCINLTNIKIPASVEEIGEYAFKGCDKIIYDLKTIPGVKILDGWVVGYTKDCPSKIDLTNFNKIADGAFDGCTVLISVKLSNSLKQIRYDVFSGCKNLTSITIPNSVTSIGCGAFSGCSGLTSITIPDSVTSIGDWAFGGCNGLTSVTIPESVEYIHEWAFMNCGGLKSFIVSPNNPSYKSVNGLLLSKDGTSLIAGINGDVVITNSVTRIEGDAFSGCRGLTSITIPDSVTSIGDWAFSGCSNLKSAIFLGDAPEFVGDDIFDNCVNGFVIKVKKGTKGWNGDYNSTALPATWQGYPIIYTDQFFYKVAFNANGGTGKMAAQTLIYDRAANLNKNAFTRSGYTFLGWAKSATGAVVYKNVAAVKNLRSTAGTVTLYARWAKTKYKIAFYANGGTGSMSAQTMTYNKAAYLKNNAFKRSGYTFLGWAKSATGAVVYKNAAAVKNLTASGATIKLYARWAKTKYKIAFYANGGKGSMATQSMTYNKAAYLTKNAFKRTGYVFAGWAKSATGSVVYTNGKAVKNLSASGATIKLYAKWKPISYTIAFNANGGSGTMANQAMTYNKAAYLSKNAFKRSECMFLGWAKTAKGAIAYKNAAAVKNLRSTAGTITLYARWAKINYQIAFNANGGSGTMANQVMTYNKAAYLTKNAFKRTGYTFQGWAKSATGAVVYKNAAAVKNLSGSGATINLYAIWKPITYKIAFNANGGKGSMASKGMTYNKAAYLSKNAFTRSGYVFIGWAKSATGAVAYKNAAAVKNLRSTAGTITLYARWAKSTYKVAFYANGGSGSMSAQAMTYNKAAYLKKNAFKRTGYTFKGWAKSPTGSVVYTNGKAVKNLTTNGGTVKLYAVWEQKMGTYMVIDLYGGLTVQKFNVTYMDSVPEGGWTDEYKTTKLVLRKIKAGKMPRTDIDITLTKDYYIGVFEVTQKQWALIVGGSPSYYSGTTKPVECVSYDDIRGGNLGSQWPLSNSVDQSSFMGILREKTGIIFDLPTEAQWEYACRAGSSQDCGLLADGSTGIFNEMCWYYDNSSDRTHIVGTKTPNAWGLYDMHGNVLEQCLDWYSDSYFGVDPVGDVYGNGRVLRGGSCLNYDYYCWSSYRNADADIPGHNGSRGLRVAAPAGL